MRKSRLPGAVPHPRGRAARPLPTGRGIEHRHKCSACGDPRKRDCECSEPEAPSNCNDRIPGERNLKCPLALAMGRENLTQLMIEDRKKAESWQDGIDYF